MLMDTKRIPVVALLLCAASYLGAAETSPLDPQQVYVQKATWSETMLATRDNCAEWAKTAPEFKLQGTSAVAVWSRIAKDWPAQCGWFTRDLPGGRHLDWFLHARDVSFESWIMRGWTPQQGGTAADLHEEFAELQRAKVPPRDPRWLDLYGRGCRVRGSGRGDEPAVARRTAASHRVSGGGSDARQDTVRGRTLAGIAKPSEPMRRRRPGRARGRRGGIAAGRPGARRGDAGTACRRRRTAGNNSPSPSRGGTESWRVC